MAEAGGDWKMYVEMIYGTFRRDFIESQPRLQGKWVRCRRDPLFDGKEAGFWHCISEGPDEDSRQPDLRRCERIGWIRPIIENAPIATIDVWQNTRGSDKRTLLWFSEEFLVVLAQRTRARDRFEYYQLITAYCTEQPSRKRKLIRERDACKGKT